MSVVDLLLKFEEQVISKSEKQIINLSKRFPEFQKFYQNLNERDKLILTSYITDGYSLLNKFLYTEKDDVEISLQSYKVFMESLEKSLGGDDDKKELTQVSKLVSHLADIIFDVIEDLDCLFLKAPKLTSTESFYRGAVMKITDVNSMLNNKEYTFKNFLSTSPFEEYSLTFTQNITSSEYCSVLFELVFYSGTLFIPNSTDLTEFFKNPNSDKFYGDEELIFQRNMKFDIVSSRSRKIKRIESHDKTLKKINHLETTIYFIKMKQQKKQVVPKLSSQKELKNRIKFKIDSDMTSDVYIIM